MNYAVGETVMYPHHGAALVEGSETRTINGEDQTYLVLRITSPTGLVVRVPTCNLDAIGVRHPANDHGLQQVLAVLRAEPSPQPSSWARRHRANADKLRTGSAVNVAEVVRDLGRRRRDGRLSATEDQMLTEAHRILLSELAHCGQTLADQAQELVEEVVAC